MVNVQVTTSALDKEEVVRIFVLLPVLMPFIFHWYKGFEPAFIVLATNVAADPVQIVSDAVVIFTKGNPLLFKLTTMLLDVAIPPPAQLNDGSGVNVQVTTSALASEELVKTALFIPALIPFTFH